LYPIEGFSQFLRLGPFYFDAQSGLDLVYSTNVEGERPDEAERDGEDYFVVPSITLRSSSIVGPRMNLDVLLGYSHEKHFKRDDLDVDLGEISGVTRFELEPFDLSAGAYWTRDTEMVDEDVFVPEGLPDQKRKVGTSAGYDLELVGSTEYVEFGVAFGYVEERFDDEEFALEEKNEGTLSYDVSVQVARQVNIKVEIEETTTDFINDDEGETTDKTENITIDTDQLFGLLERPKLTYSIGVKREYDGGETEGWELIHRLQLSDEYQLSSVVELAIFASYEYEQKPDEDDIALQYGLLLTHEISRRATQTFGASRKPVETLGSTDDTEETKFIYGLNINDFILVNVKAIFSAEYSIDKPLEGAEEKIWSYSAGLSHTKPINLKLSRSLSYLYTLEDSNLESELLEEHRVTLSFIYNF